VNQHEESLHFETLAARAGVGMRIGDTISTAPLIDPSTTFTYETVNRIHEALGPEGQGFAYARNANPTVVALEQVVASLEGADEAVAFASGMAAIAAAIQAFSIEAGDTIVAGSGLYGGTRGLFTQLLSYDIQTRYVDIFDLDAVAAALTETGSRLLYLESMTNPLVEVPDVEALVNVARPRGAAVILDNTFATPFLFQPLRRGVDLVVHSASKFLAGHGDVIAGLVVGDRSRARAVRDIRTVTGAVLSPFEAWLTMRGIRTLPLRMQRHSESALRIARWLEGQPWVERVHYPGLPSHPQHAIARRELGDLYGGMLAFDLKGGREDALRFLDALRVFVPGTSLGDVESLVLYPPLASHRQLDEEALRRIGIGQGTIRMSVGLEAPSDLESDLRQAAERSGLLKVTAAQL